MQVDYEFDSHTSTWNSLHDEQHLNKNLSILLEWSPFTTEAELLNQVCRVSREIMHLHAFHWLILNSITSLMLNLFISFCFYLAVWRHWLSWYQDNSLQSMAEWWWKIGARFWVRPRGYLTATFYEWIYCYGFDRIYCSTVLLFLFAY